MRILDTPKAARGTIFKSFNFEKSVIFVIKDGEVFGFWRFDKINLWLSPIEGLIPANVLQLEIIEYNEFLIMAIVENTSRLLKIYSNSKKNI